MLTELNAACPPGLRFHAAAELSGADPGLSRILSSARYVAALADTVLEALGGAAQLERLIGEFVALEEHIVVRSGPHSGKRVDVRASCEGLWRAGCEELGVLEQAGIREVAAALVFQLVLGPQATARPRELVHAVLGMDIAPDRIVRAALVAGASHPLDLAQFRRASGTAATSRTASPEAANTSPASQTRPGTD